MKFVYYWIRYQIANLLIKDEVLRLRFSTGKKVAFVNQGYIQLEDGSIFMRSAWFEERYSLEQMEEFANHLPMK